MTNASQGTNQLRDKLIERYRKCSEIDQQILQLMSIIYEPVSRAVIVECLNAAGIRDRQKKAFTAASIKSYIDPLIEAQLVTQGKAQGPQCHTLLMEVATRDAIAQGRFDKFVKAIEQQIPIRLRWNDGPRMFSTEQQFIREVRIGIYRGDVNFIEKQFEAYYRYNYYGNKITIDRILDLVYNNPFDPDWFLKLPQEYFEGTLWQILVHSAYQLQPAPEAFSLLWEEWESDSDRCTDSLCVLLTEQCILRGNLDDAEEVLGTITDPERFGLDGFRGWLAFLRGQNEEAIAYFAQGLKSLRKITGKRKGYYTTLCGVFYVMALLKEGTGKSLSEATEYTGLIPQNHALAPLYAILKQLLKLQQGDLSQKELIGTAVFKFPSGQNSIETMIRALCFYWADPERARKFSARTLEPFYHEAVAAEYFWLATEAAELLGRLKPKSDFVKRAAALKAETGIHVLTDLVQPQEAWELCLNALVNLRQDGKPAAQPKPEGNQRLAWFVTFYPSHCLLQPREQQMNAKGVWSKGRNIALKRLVENAHEFTYLTDQDRRVCAQLQLQYNYGYQQSYVFGEKGIAALVGHPTVFWDDGSGVQVEIVKGEPELVVKQGKGDRLTLQFLPEPQENRDVVVVKEGLTRLKVIEITPEHRRIAEILGKQNRLEVPTAAKERVLEAVGAVSGIVTVQSDIGGGNQSLTEVPSDSTPHVHLLPAGEGLKVAVLARPFATGGPYYRPGSGGVTVIAEIDGQRRQTTRNLLDERRRAKEAIAACPTLIPELEQEGEWLLDDPEECLEFLLELGTLSQTPEAEAGQSENGKVENDKDENDKDPAQRVIVEWPQGEKLRVKQQVGFSNLQLKIQRQSDWFSASGELQLGDNEVLEMQQLMALLDKSAGRFVPLGDGQFLALTQEFRKRLDELRAYSEQTSKGLRFHPLATLALEDFVDEVEQLKVDKHWKEHIKRLREMKDLEPELPSTLQAELRDYQLDGFRWLARLAHWGVGACLADDMGLGKTLQALAVILTRAPQGPTLVIAPTSVGMNWASEAQKFAPTLQIIQFGSGDRQKILDQLQPFDLLICTYGLLQQEEVAEMLSHVQWQTIVLDEAQAIKNFATKRSQAAMNLQGGFKLITTGTPIENHLGELWNLFRFINPGLLGSLERFNQRFATPIERYQDKNARNQLKKLVQPFLLRRTKSQVLQELPARTEIVLHVELSKEEKALYEAMRREAIERIENSDANVGAKHLQVLAEIMKLRRTCCNPQLVMPGSEISSSKLNLFGEVLGELLENRHKALVFSQFVDHLKIIRKYLDSQNIHYQYLDGSTPAGERKKRVNAFQAGEGDVFLISLKAGGTGLNLTAADYVIHMDPWWNPAVEDQASDRAHRIGQQRPVTIYRLLAKDTIEDKIVQLHALKRDLADSLLEGTDISGKISTDDLLKLINEQ